MAAHWLYCAAAPGAYTGLERAASYTQGARHSLGSSGARAGSLCRVSSSGCDSVPRWEQCTGAHSQNKKSLLFLILSPLLSFKNFSIVHFKFLNFVLKIKS